MKFSSISAVLAVLTASVLALPAPAVKRGVTVSQLYQFPSGSWIENFCVRSNGNLVLSRYDKAEVWELNPLAQNPTPNLLHSFTGASGVVGCAETSPDVFVVTVQTKPTLVSYVFAVWSINFNTAGGPTFTKVADINGAMFLNGLAAPTPSSIVLTDTMGGNIYHVNLRGGAVSNPITDVTNVITDAGLGVNGLRASANGNFIYTSNLITGAFKKTPINPATGVPTGPATTVAQTLGLVGSDDFALTGNGDEAYICNFALNQILRINNGGSIDIVAGTFGPGSIASPTAARFGRTNADKTTLYVSTANNLLFGNSARIFAVKL